MSDDFTSKDVLDEINPLIEMMFGDYSLPPEKLVLCNEYDLKMMLFQKQDEVNSFLYDSVLPGEVKQRIPVHLFKQMRQELPKINGFFMGFSDDNCYVSNKDLDDAKKTTLHEMGHRVIALATGYVGIDRVLSFQSNEEDLMISAEFIYTKLHFMYGGNMNDPLFIERVNRHKMELGEIIRRRIDEYSFDEKLKKIISDADSFMERHKNIFKYLNNQKQYKP